MLASLLPLFRPDRLKLSGRSIRMDILSGLTVALALVPEAVAFAFVAGVHPLTGLYAAFMVGLVTSLIGGRPGMISGATGALAVVMVTLVAQHGVEYLFATVVLMGILQILAGVFRLGKFIRLVPYPVMLGFVNGLAIVIFLAQLQSFQFKGADGQFDWLVGAELYVMGGLVLLTMGIIWLLPRFTKVIPGPLAAILIISALVIGFGLETQSVGDLASIEGVFPPFHIADVALTLETLWIILPYAFVLASIGLIESLLTLTLIDELTETRGRASQECVGQGFANVLSGFFSGMGGCAMIGQSMINVNSGGRGRLSGLSAALFLLSFILLASSLIEQIPLAALTGIMFMVVIGTFEWSSFRIIRKIPRHDAFVIILVSGVTVMTDLAVAVLVGVIVSALVFAWRSAKHIWVAKEIDTQGRQLYRLQGPLFFGSVTEFRDLFDPKEDPENVIIDFANCRVWDHSAIAAIDNLAERYQKLGKHLKLVHLSADCKLLMDKASDIVQLRDEEDPHYGIFMDYPHPKKK